MISLEKSLSVDWVFLAHPFLIKVFCAKLLPKILERYSENTLVPDNAATVAKVTAFYYHCVWVLFFFFSIYHADTHCYTLIVVCFSHSDFNMKHPGAFCCCRRFKPRTMWIFIRWHEQTYLAYMDNRIMFSPALQQGIFYTPQ